MATVLDKIKEYKLREVAERKRTRTTRKGGMRANSALHLMGLRVSKELSRRLVSLGARRAPSGKPAVLDTKSLPRLVRPAG